MQACAEHPGSVGVTDVIRSADLDNIATNRTPEYKEFGVFLEGLGDHFRVTRRLANRLDNEVCLLQE